MRGEEVARTLGNPDRPRPRLSFVFARQWCLLRSVL